MLQDVERDKFSQILILQSSFRGYLMLQVVMIVSSCQLRRGPSVPSSMGIKSKAKECLVSESSQEQNAVSQILICFIIVIINDTCRSHWIIFQCAIRAHFGFLTRDRVLRSRIARSADELLSPLHVLIGREGFRIPGGVSVGGVDFRFEDDVSEDC